MLIAGSMHSCSVCSLMQTSQQSYSACSVIGWARKAESCLCLAPRSMPSTSRVWNDFDAAPGSSITCALTYCEAFAGVVTCSKCSAKWHESSVTPMGYNSACRSSHAISFSPSQHQLGSQAEQRPRLLHRLAKPVAEPAVSPAPSSQQENDIWM